MDLVGKGNYVRSVLIPSWVKVALDEWAVSAGIGAGLVIRAIHKGGFIKHESITPQAIRDIVKDMARKLGNQNWRHMTCGGRSQGWHTKAVLDLTRYSYLLGIWVSRQLNGILAFLKTLQKLSAATWGLDWSKLNGQ